jgi:hypothetical protein
MRFSVCTLSINIEICISGGVQEPPSVRPEGPEANDSLRVVVWL